ncbi:MAG: hypothetical protein ACWGOV_08225 [Acidiferrobacterales bacterium]
MTRFTLWTSLFILVTPVVYADEQQLGQDCDQVERVLLSVPNAKYSRDWGVFQGKDGESVYGGCVMVVTGSRSSSAEFESRFNQLYPTDDNEFGKSGWTLENPEDNKQEFTIVRNGNFCQVSGSWDERDVSSPSTDSTIRVECGVQEE